MRQSLQRLLLLTFVAMLFFLGFVAGFYSGTGLLPDFSIPLFPNEGDIIVTPKGSATTLTEIQVILDEAPEEEYAFGYNCVDFAWDAQRELAWKGQHSAIVMLMYEEEPYHAILLVPTTDKGWLFIEPQGGIVVKPRVGGLYSGKRIEAIKIKTTIWVPIDEFVKNPVFMEIQ